MPQFMKKPSNFYSRKLLLVSLFKNYNFFLPVHNLRNNCMNDHFIRMTTKDSSITGCGTVRYSTVQKLKIVILDEQIPYSLEYGTGSTGNCHIDFIIFFVSPSF